MIPFSVLDLAPIVEGGTAGVRDGQRRLGNHFGHHLRPQAFEKLLAHGEGDSPRGK